MDCESFEYAVIIFRAQYNISNKCTRILTKLLLLRISKEMADISEKSRLGMFQKFSANSMSLQEQLEPSYRNDRMLCDWLMSAGDIMSVQVSPTDGVLCTAEQLTNGNAS